MSSPLWGNFVGYADWDLLAFAWLFQGGLHVSSYYHAVQSIEKYLKALALAIIDPDGKVETAKNNRWLLSHDLEKLARRCAGRFPFYGQPQTVALLKRFSEFDQVARYPWVEQKYGNGFTTEDIPSLWDLIKHLRTDIPIKKDDYILGMLVRGYHHGNSEHRTNARRYASILPGLRALQVMFPDIAQIVR